MNDQLTNSSDGPLRGSFLTSKTQSRIGFQKDSAKNQKEMAKKHCEECRKSSKSVSRSNRQKTNERKIILQQPGPRDSELKGLAIVTCETG